MASIFPFRGYRYSSEAGDINRLTSLLSIDNFQEYLDKQYLCPENIIHLFLPKDIQRSESRFNEWKKEGILKKELQPAIYTYRQTYLSKDGNRKNLQGFICLLQIREWKDNIVLRHEATMPHSMDKRLSILQATGLNSCPTHGLYTDTNLVLEKAINESLKNPILKFSDDSGVENTFSIINSPTIIELFQKTVSDKQIIIADGHHRYEASLQLRNKLGLSNESLDAANYHLIHLTNTESNELEIYPTHRIIADLKDFDQNKIVHNLREYFTVTLIDPANVDREVRNSVQNLGIVFKENAFLLRLKEGLIEKITWKFPDLIKELDLTIVHYYIIEKVFGIEGKKQIYSDKIYFSSDAASALKDVQLGKYQMAILTREVSQEQIKEVCYSGYTMPHKSTYFFPKILCGLVMSSIKDKEI